MNNIELTSVKTDKQLTTASPEEATTSNFANHPTKKQDKTNSMLSKFKKYTPSKKRKALSAMSVKVNYKKSRDLIQLSYIHSQQENTEILIASLRKKHLFNPINLGIKLNFGEKISNTDFKKCIAETFLELPATTDNLLESAVTKNIKIYNYRYEDPISPAKQKDSKINKQGLYVELDSLIYVKKYCSSLDETIHNLASKCNNSLCIESEHDLLNDQELQNLAKNDLLKAVLTEVLGNNNHCFRIYANSVIPNMQKNIYLNFFNIPDYYLNSVNIDKNDLKMQASPIIK